MGRKEIHHLCPSNDQGQATADKTDRFSLSTNDCRSAPIFLQFCLYFAVGNLDVNTVAAAIASLKSGLEATLTQYRGLLAGTIEKNIGDENESGLSYSIVVDKDSAVHFTVHWLDSNDDAPFFTDLADHDFASTQLNDVSLFCLEEMAFSRDTGPASPDKHPPVFGAQANILPHTTDNDDNDAQCHGIALTIHFHHWAMDFAGFVGLVQHWAENTAAHIPSRGDDERQGTDVALSPINILDLACLDRTSPSIQQLNLPIKKQEKWELLNTALAHPSVSLFLFHLSKTKAETLKQLATPSTADGSGSESRISTYDAFSALWWRLLTKHRAKTNTISSEDLNNTCAEFSAVVNMRSRVVPPLPARYMGNALLPISSSSLSEPQTQMLTLTQVISEAPLAKLAAHIRAVTNLATGSPNSKAQQQDVQQNRHPIPAMTFKVTDWRGGRSSNSILEADFGPLLGKPRCFRHLFGNSKNVSSSNIYVYPLRYRHTGGKGGIAPKQKHGRRGADDLPGTEPVWVDGEREEEGVFEFSVPVEESAVGRFLEDEDVREWFEYKGVEVA